jgi:parvulin-like peptidyl-prolyl isomerase
MRLSRSIGIFLCAAIIYAIPVFRAGAADGPPAGERAALVNGALITAEAFDNELKRVERLSLRDKNVPAVVSRKQVLENLIVRELMYQEALKQGIRVPAGEVSEQLDQLSRRLPSGAGLESALDRMGLSSVALEQQLERGLVIQKLLVRKFSEAAVSDSEVAGFYREHQDDYRVPLRLRLSHILVKVEPFPSFEKMQELRSRMETLRVRLAKGEDFAMLARQASDCYSAKNGGDLGYFLSGQLSRKMEDQALALKPGEVSQVVEDRYGLHLLKLTELRPEAVLPLARVREQIREGLKAKRLRLDDLAPFVKKLRAAAKVEILLNEKEQ